MPVVVTLRAAIATVVDEPDRRHRWDADLVARSLQCGGEVRERFLDEVPQAFEEDLA